jgi:branched-chain amino acid transport system substrate-binding protein
MAEEKKEGNTDEEDEEVGFGSGFWWFMLIVLIGIGAVWFLRSGGITGNFISGGSDDTIKIGVMAPLTGDAASYGLGVQNGIEMAKEDLGLNIEIIYEDTQCEGREAVTAINKLISIDDVDAIIGELCSGATLAVAPIAEESRIPMISPASTSPDITNSGDYIFRTVPSDELQGGFGADLVKDLGFEKLAILYSNEDYGLGFNNVLEEKFDGEVVASEPFERGANDLRAQITKIKNSGADAIYIISNSPDSAVAALVQIEQLGLKAQVFGSEGLKSDDISFGAGDASEGLIITSVSTGTEEFFQKHKRVYGIPPGPFASQGYDALQAISIALEGAKNSEQIKNNLYDVSFNGVSGKIDFDENGDIKGSYELYKVRAGNFIPISVFDLMESLAMGR